MHSEQLRYFIGLKFIPGIGDIIAKNLIAYIGSAEGIFKEKKQNLLKIPKIGPQLADTILNSSTLKKVDEEIAFIERYNIKTLIYTEDNYPTRLKQCEDSPIILFIKGNVDFNSPKTIGIVGTRNATSYGKDMCRQTVSDIKPHNPIIISGLASGIDIYAHKAALENNLQTIAVLGHGLDTIYPAEHKSTASQIANQGALVTEHCSKSIIDKANFVKRNRIIAGLSDAVIIVESGEKGGALITAEYACSYNRDILAFPGKSTDKYSIGCNNLIKTNKAALITAVKDIEYQLNWEIQPKQEKQKSLFVELSQDETLILSILSKDSELNIDIISSRANLPMNKVSAILLSLEFNGLVKTLPGKLFTCI